MAVVPEITLEATLLLVAVESVPVEIDAVGVVADAECNVPLVEASTDADVPATPETALVLPLLKSVEPLEVLGTPAAVEIALAEAEFKDALSIVEAEEDWGMLAAEAKLWPDEAGTGTTVAVLTRTV